MRDGAETRNVEVDVTEGKGIEIKSEISGLLVLKSTNSQFHGFIRDEYTTLPETWDRILSTEVDGSWRWTTFKDLDHVKSEAHRFDNTWQSARDITLRLFAEDNSASVQNTMYKMGEKILEASPFVKSVDYTLPNKHYFEVGKFSSPSIMAACPTNIFQDLSWHKGLSNKGKDAEVYAPQSSPNGLIKCTVVRSGEASKL